MSKPFKKAVACFPLTHPGKQISLRDKDGEEVGHLADLASSGDHDAELVKEALRAGGFLFQVTGVRTVEREHEVRVWTVETEQGTRKFQTRLDHWPRPLESGGYLIQDICEDLYFITDPEALDERSRRLLFSFTG